MDKNSIIGLLLIGAILVGFSIYNTPSDEDVAAQQKIELENAKADSLKNIKEPATIAATDNNVEVIAEAEPIKNIYAPKVGENGLIVLDPSGNPLYYNTITGLDTIIVPTSPTVIEVKSEEIFTIENEKLKLEFTSKGGHLHNAYIKDYKSYGDYMLESDAYLHLLDSTSSYAIQIDIDGNLISTTDYDFTVVNQTENSITLASDIAGKVVEYEYALRDSSWDLGFNVSFEGFGKADAAKTKMITDFKLKSTEKYLLNEQRNATIYFDDEGSYDYLSITGDDDFEFEETTKWVAFKQLFFSAVLMNKGDFGKNSKIAISARPEFDSTYLKDYTANLNLGMSSMSETLNLTWYIGPNDYEILALHENGSQDIVDLGWGIFRWVNVYAFQPVLTAFLDWGIGAGMAILLLTIFVKLILSPVNYKMYKSSAMMKVLKPEIAELNEKYSKKEDGMKKQKALMALYKDAGASPLAGCIPMLIQMPVLIAIFRLFPSSIALRQKAFLWAEDLSTYDQVASWTGEVPLVTWAYGNHISLFTLLMAITTLLYTHFNSSNMQQPQQEGMPNMKYIMYFFPFMMIFWFNSYASGLSFYYFISTLMTMGIMFAIKKFFIDEEKIHAKMQANKANPKKKKTKSKFAQRLEEAQKLQQDKMKNK